jgi:hypothetical protein
MGVITLDKDAKINDIARRLRWLASTELEGGDVVAALQTALGTEIAALTARRNPAAGPDSLQYIMDQMLDAMHQALREAAYIAADLPAPVPYEDGRLTEEEFRELTNRIANAATRGNVPATESMTATAKALGLILCIVGRRPGLDADRLITFCQEAIGQFAREAIAGDREDRHLRL